MSCYIWDVLFLFFVCYTIVRVSPRIGTANLHFTTTTIPPTTTTPPPTTTTNCISEPSLATLYRLYRPSTDNHFYTYSLYEADNAVNNLRYNREYSPGLVATSASDCICGASLKPVYHLYRKLTTQLNDDHFYTLSETEAANAVNNLGYDREGIAFYCADTMNYCGATLPLHRYHRRVEHFYTTSLTEGNTVVGRYEGITCYIW